MFVTQGGQHTVSAAAYAGPPAYVGGQPPNAYGQTNYAYGPQQPQQDIAMNSYKQWFSNNTQFTYVMRVLSQFTFFATGTLMLIQFLWNFPGDILLFIT